MLPKAHEPVAPTHWAFGQLANIVGAPASYLRQLPAPLAGINLQYGLTNHRAEQVKTFETEDGRTELRAVTGPDYGRIHDHELVEAVQRIAGNGTGDTRWKVPGVTVTEPTLAPPMAPQTADMAQIFAAHAERAARIDALRPGNKDRLFDGLTAVGITHVTVTFNGAGDSGQIESIGAWSGETAVEFPATEIDYAALTWDDPEVEMRQLSLEDVVEQLAYDFLSDTHGGWENNDGAWGEFCFDAAARCIHLEFNERFTSSELYTHDF